MSISVVVPCSPIASHPDTSILERTLDSVRHHLPDAQLFVTFDGVRAEQESRRQDYEEFIRRALWRLDKHYGGSVPYVFDRHLHQTGMMRHVLPDITSDLLMYVESDTPLVTDEHIHFDLISKFILSGQSDLVRLHHESMIPAPHQHMMHGREGVIYTRTSQWSQRPHVASTAFYRRIMETCFTPEANSFIEDKMHGVCDEAYKINGMAGLELYKLHIYTPDGNIKRSYHTDGRAGEEKYEGAQVF